MASGFLHCSMPLHREHEQRAVAELAKHDARLVPGSVRFDGSLLHFEIDHARVPNGEARSVELVIIRAVEAAVRP